MKRYFYTAIIFLLLISTGSAEIILKDDPVEIRIVEVDGQYCLYSQKGEQISGLYDSIEPFWDDTTVVSLDGRFGLLDKEGKEVLPTIYEYIEHHDDCYVLQQDLRFGICDIDGQILVEPIYRDLYYENGTASISGESGEGVIDRDGHILVPCIYESAAPLCSGWSLIVERDSFKSNYVNEKGETLLDTSADSCYPFDGDGCSYAIARYGSDYHIVSLDKTIHRVIKDRKLSYTGIDGLFALGEAPYLTFYRADCDEYISLDGVTSDNGYFNYGLMPVKDRSGKWGYADETLQVVIPCVYDRAAAFSEYRAWTRAGEYWLLIDTNGDCYYTEKLIAARSMSEGLAAVKTDNKWGFIDSYGGYHNLTVEVKTDDLFFRNGYCNVGEPWDPYAATWIDKNFEIVCQYDLWEKPLTGVWLRGV